MDQYQYEEINLMDYVEVIWKRKWLIIIPTFVLCMIAGIISLLLPPKWEIDAIIQPSKFTVQTEQGQFEEVMIVDPKQVVGQINQESYNNLIVAELKIDLKNFPKIRAENLRDTKLVRVSIRDKNIDRGKSILSSLFANLRKELDIKIDVEIKGIDSQVLTNENEIKKKELDIRSKGIEKTKVKQQVLSAENKLKISEERYNSITEEMKSVKKRVDEIEIQQRKALEDRKKEADALSLLLYSNEIQQNLRYYNTLDANLSTEKVTQENLKLLIKGSQEDVKELDTQIDRLKNEIEDLKNRIIFLNQRKARIDYCKLIKEPTPSLFPVSPKKKINVLIAGVLGLMIFTLLVFFLEFLEKQKAKKKGAQ